MDTPASDNSPSTSSASPAGVFGTLTHFGAVDWARGHHDLCVVDPVGKVVLEMSIDDTPEAWADVRARIAALKASDASPAIVGFAIETSSGPAVERLLEADWPVFPLNPKAAERFRDRKAPSGSKNDRLDAYCFADALRTDGHGWRQLRPQDPLTYELRLLCRDEITLIGQRTALVNQLQAALVEYYPTALAAFDDWTSLGAWEFLIAFPTPHHLASAGKRKWENFLHAHKLYRPETAAKRILLFNVARKSASPNTAVTAAKSLLAVSLAKQLRVLQAQLDEYRVRINELFARHPDHDLFGSLPGAGEKLAPRLLAELGADREVFDSPEGGACVLLRPKRRSSDREIRAIPSGVLPPRLQQNPAVNHSPVGRPQPHEVHLGRRVLPTETPTGQRARRGPAMPGDALAQNPVENVAAADSLRPRTPPARPDAPRLLGDLPYAATSSAIQLNTFNNQGEYHGAKNSKFPLYSRENIFPPDTG